ncbi:MAG: lipoprotein [Kangiellaceae bacterium]|nr:lipoprotein [Kangiellaceae bacterium]
MTKNIPIKIDFLSKIVENQPSNVNLSSRALFLTKILILVVICSFLSACGSKGELFVPDEIPADQAHEVLDKGVSDVEKEQPTELTSLEPNIL